MLLYSLCAEIVLRWLVFQASVFKLFLLSSAFTQSIVEMRGLLVISDQKCVHILPSNIPYIKYNFINLIS